MLRFFLLLLSVTASAQMPGAKMLATADLNLRKSAPSGPLNQPGPQTGIVRKGETVVYRETRIVKNLFATYRWFRVDIPPAKNNEAAKSGWVFAGSQNGPAYLVPDSH